MVQIPSSIHTYGVCDYVGEEWRFLIETWQNELRHSEAKIHVEGCETQFVINLILHEKKHAFI